MRKRIKMKCIFAFLISIFCFFGFLQQGSLAVPIFGNGTLGSFEGTISYNPTVAALTVSLTNTSPVDNGGYITDFAFNNPFDSIADVSLSSTDSDFVLLGGSSFNNSVSAMPYGDFDIGVSLSNKGNNPFQGGGSPQEGIGVGITETFTFALTGVDLDVLDTQDFLDELSIGSATDKLPTFFIARFRGFNDGGNNKIPATSPIPEPTTLLLLSIGIAGLAGVGTRRCLMDKKKENIEE